MDGLNFCYLHNPAISEEVKKEARTRGGKLSRGVRASLPPIKLNQTKDIVSLLGTAINGVREGRLDVRVANCIGYLAGHLIKAFEVSDLEKRLENLESTVRR